MFGWEEKYKTIYVSVAVFVLRKKQKHVSLLRVVHHRMMPFNTWLAAVPSRLSLSCCDTFEYFRPHFNVFILSSSSHGSHLLEGYCAVEEIPHHSITRSIRWNLHSCFPAILHWVSECNYQGLGWVLQVFFRGSELQILLLRSSSGFNA